MFRIVSYRSCIRRGFAVPMAIVLACTGLISGPTTLVALAATIVPVTYDSFNKVVYIGSDYSAADPAQAPYVTYPSHPNAPKSAITLPELDEALTALGYPDLVGNEGSAWALRTDTVVRQTARFDLTAASISELRLDSDPASGKFPALTKLIANGGALNINGIRVVSWAGTGPDTNYYDGRSYLLAENGGRMDIISAEVSHLGWAAGEPSGLSWRKRGTNTPGDMPTDDMNIIRTGSTGSILNSNIHDNYFGQYSYEAFGLVVKNNEFHHNVLHGFDPHDYSTGFEVAYNKVYNNGKHGIIFSLGCTLNRIHHNEVYGNAENGIMLDRGSNVNQIADNLVYNNRDGIAIFQSEQNFIQGNTLRGNERGVRINATFDQGDIFDGLSNENVVLGNTIEDNSQYGVYLYERADKNVIEGNTITGSGASGVYIKTGGNTIKGNAIRVNDNGVTIVGGEPITPGGVPPSYDGGYKNVLQGNVIEDNNTNGVQLKGAIDTLIGLPAVNSLPAQANSINTNGLHGVSIDSGATKNSVVGNAIRANQLDGVLVKGVDTIKNKISRNSITANGRRGISLTNGGNLNLAAPTITSATDATTITGTAIGAKTVEIYRDTGGQGNVYKGSAVVNTSGSWSFTLPPGDNIAEGAITVLAIDASGNTSPFGGNAAGGNQATYTIGTGTNGDTTVFISGPGSNVTLPDIERALKVISPTTELLVLEDAASKVWQSNISLFVNRGVTLTLTADTVSWLKLRSQGADIRLTRAEGDDAAYNYKSFVSLRTYNGVVTIDGVKITSWDAVQNTVDTDISNGRSYLLAKYNARMDITNSDLSYLGSADGESYGVSWRDIDSSEAPGVLQTRVTGQVLNSIFSNNYYGIYTYQASNMVFRDNKFHHNIGYGFDPHDFSHHFTVENNEAYENGNHGFIISRGCNNFVFRGNKSYNNRYTIGTEVRRAHGFMLDPGSPNSRYSQVPSYNNVLENNEAWGNDGYGLRIVGSITNTVQLNTFRDNLQGITVEQNSTGNVIKNNTISGSGLYGIYLFSGSDDTMVTGNTVTKSGKHGIYIKTGGNTITENIVSENGSLVNGVTSGSGIATLRETDLAAARADFVLPGAKVSIASADSELLNELTTVGDVDSNVISKNSVTKNFDEGIELKGAIGTQVTENTVQGNGSNGIYLTAGTSGTMVKKNIVTGNLRHGIRANGSDVFSNTWTENQVFENKAGGIINTSSANNGMRPPVLTRKGNEVTGTATPGTIIELYSDMNGQGRYFETRVTAGADGSFRVQRSWRGSTVNATATDANGNTSGFTYNVAFFIPTSRVYLPITQR